MTHPQHDPGLAIVVDDVEGNRILAAAYLRRIGWRVATCASAMEALQFLARTIPAAMLVDVRMPGMTGDQLAAAIRKNTWFRDIRLVAYTAHAHPDEIENFRRSGFHDVLIKPALLADMNRVLPAPAGA